MAAEPNRLAILADDFTGACDAAAAFAGIGHSTMVLLEAPSRWPAETEVLAVDLDGRERPGPEARERAQLGADLIRSLVPGARLLLKIDSTLRGPIAALVDGVLEGSREGFAVVAPAFPEQGRLLVNGRLRLAEGEAGSSMDLAAELQAPLVPVASAAVESELEPAVLRLAESGPVPRPKRVVVDADRIECLAAVAAVWWRHPGWLLVGSAGVARRVAELWKGPVVVEWPGGQAGAGPVLVVAGSLAAATRQQLEQIRSEDEVVVLSTPAAAANGTEHTHAAALAETVRQWADVHPLPRGVVLTGGATARQVCQRLGTRGVRLAGELAPGVPIGWLVGGVWHGVAAVTKAGGFGGPHLLLDAVHALGASSAHTP